MIDKIENLIETLENYRKQDEKNEQSRLIKIKNSNL
jgi:hypothetical protein